MTIDQLEQENAELRATVDRLTDYLEADSELLRALVDADELLDSLLCAVAWDAGTAESLRGQAKCAYCGEVAPVGDELRRHMLLCESHPMSEMKAERDVVRAENVALIAELEALEGANARSVVQLSEWIRVTGFSTPEDFVLYSRS